MMLGPNGPALPRVASLIDWIPEPCNGGEDQGWKSRPGVGGSVFVTIFLIIFQL